MAVAEPLDLPIAQSAVNRARRAFVLAAVRAGVLTGANAAKIIGTSRTYLYHLINQTDEGDGSQLNLVTTQDRAQLTFFLLPDP